MSILEPVSDSVDWSRGTILKPIKGLKVRRIKRIRHMPIKGLRVRPMQELNLDKVEQLEEKEEMKHIEGSVVEKLEEMERREELEKTAGLEEREGAEIAEEKELTGGERGSAIISAVVILLLLVGLVAGLSSLIINESSLSTYELSRTRAFYIAEAGLEYASTVLEKSAEWDAATGELSGEALSRINSLFTGGELRRVSRSDNLSEHTVTVISTGAWRGIEKRITAVFRPASQGSAAFSHSLVSRGRMSFYDNSRITGNVSGGDLYSNAGIYTYDKFILTDCTARENQLESIFPTIDLAAIRNYPDRNTSLDNIGGNLTYINTDLQLEYPMQINGGGIMLVDGDLVIDDQIYFNSEESFVLIVRGDILIKDISGGRGLIYGYGDVEINDVQNFKGSLFAGGDLEAVDVPGTLVCNDAIDVTFDNDYINTFAEYGIHVENSNGQSLFEYKLLSWTEL